MTAHPIPQRRRLPAAPRTVFFAALGLGLASAMGVLLVFAWPSGAGSPEPVLFSIAAEDVPAAGGDPVAFAAGRFWLVNLLPEEGTHREYGVLGHGGLIALFWRDPHLGCTVPWRSEVRFEGSRGWFRNPCHGETYTKAGVRVFGPAPRSLDTYPLEVRSDGRVIVNTTQTILGAVDNPTRAVPYSPD